MEPRHRTGRRRIWAPQPSTSRHHEQKRRRQHPLPRGRAPRFSAIGTSPTEDGQNAACPLGRTSDRPLRRTGILRHVHFWVHCILRCPLFGTWAFCGMSSKEDGGRGSAALRIWRRVPGFSDQKYSFTKHETGFKSWQQKTVYRWAGAPNRWLGGVGPSSVCPTLRCTV